MSLIYRDYLCDAQEKNRLLMLDSKAIEEQEEIRRKKYEINFGERKEKIIQYRKNYETNSPSDDNYEKTLIVPQNEKWYKKVFRFFRKIFKFI